MDQSIGYEMVSIRLIGVLFSCLLVIDTGGEGVGVARRVLVVLI